MSSNTHTHSEEQEENEVYERTAPPGIIVYRAIYNEAEHELKRGSVGLGWSGVAAGLSMGFSMIAQALLRANLPDEQWRSLITPLGYTIGFLIVILGRQQLFTENTLTPILPLLKNRKLAVLRNVGRLWGVVLAANLLGGFLFAAAVAHTDVLSPEVHVHCVEICREATSHNFMNILVRGIFAGWLIALMVWLLPFAESARVWVIVILSYLVGLGGLSHIIAGGIEAFFLVSVGEISLWKSLSGYILPTFIGNTLGGVALVAALVHAQFIAAEPKENHKTD